MGVESIRVSGTNRRPLLQKDIETANANTKSAAEAARYLHVNFATYRKYAKLYGLFDAQKNPKGSGISRKKRKGTLGLDAILRGEHPTYSHAKLRQRIVEAGILPNCCALCGYNKVRPTDNKVPLILLTMDNNPLNLKLENLELRCFNCVFITNGWIAPKKLKELNSGVFEHDLLTIHGVTTTELSGLRTEIEAELEDETFDDAVLDMYR